MVDCCAASKKAGRDLRAPVANGGWPFILIEGLSRHACMIGNPQHKVMRKPASQAGLDVQIGQLIRAMRTARGWSQGDLAKRVGLSFQQVQKYENGHSRILASKLHEFATVFGVDVGQFFKGPPQFIGDDDGAKVTPVFAKDTWKLAAQFDRIKDKETRSKLMDLVSALAKGE